MTHYKLNTPKRMFYTTIRLTPKFQSPQFSKSVIICANALLYLIIEYRLIKKHKTFHMTLT